LFFSKNNNKIIKLGLNNKLLREVVRKKVQKRCCNYLLGIIYKLLEGSRGDGKEVVRQKDKKKLKKSSKKVQKKVQKKVE
jgi:hypothetical protein